MSEELTTQQPAAVRDAVEAAFEQHAEVPEVKSEDKARDEKGRFTKSDAGVEAVQAKPDTGVAGTETKPRAQRPSSWKKDYEGYWEKLHAGGLTPEEGSALAEYLGQREQEYAKGVSTYKNEWEQAKPLIEAITPFMPLLQQHNIAPQQWIANLGNAHRTLALGSPQEKLQMFARLAQDYGVPIQALLQQPGQVDPLQYVNPLYERINQLQGQVQTFVSQQEQAQQAQVQSEIAAFAKDKTHFEAVREKMAGLLQAGLAEDLQDAYNQAIRLNDEIWNSEQQRIREAQEAEQRQQRNDTVARKRASATSPRSTTPAAVTSNSGRKGVRSAIEDAFESIAGGERV